MSKKSSSINTKRHIVAGKLASLALTNAFVFQAELAENDSRVKHLDEILKMKDPREGFIEHWLFIRDNINYVEIFRIARSVLELLPRRNETNDALRYLANKVSAIVRQRAALRHDLMGRIYHKLLLEAKFLGTFYTSVPAATMLMKLAIDSAHWEIDWTNREEIEKLRFADIACGTGTLLMASEQAVVDRFIRQSAHDGKAVEEADVADLHRRLIEHVIHGYDVLSSAVHLTASTLALLAIDTAFHSMNLYAMKFGVSESGNAALGSLDFLQTMQLQPQMSFIGEDEDEGLAVAVTGHGPKKSKARLPILDLCCINPPFTRSAGTNLLFGSLPQSQRAALQKRMSQILKEATRKGQPVDWSTTAGLGSMFVAVAASRIRPGGCLALVLPAALAFGPTWAPTRRLLARNFFLEYIVSSHDPDRWAFSESTELSEVLIVARRYPDGSRPANPMTTVINLWRNPATPADALAVGESIVRTAPPLLLAEGTPQRDVVYSVMSRKKKVGEAFTVPWRSIRETQWRPISFAQTELNRVAWLMSDGKFRLPTDKKSSVLSLVPLDSLGELGPDGRDVYDCFERSASRSSFPALWGYDANTMTTMRGKVNEYLTVRTEAAPNRPERPVDLVWPKAGRIMLPDKIWLPTRRVIAVRLDKVAVSNVWWPFKMRKANEKSEKALALWFNSSLALVLLLWTRVPTRGPWLKFKKPLLSKLPTLDVLSLTNNQLERLADDYDRLSREPLGPLPHLDSDPIRSEIDKALAEVLHLPGLDRLRELLSREPIISDHRIS